MGAGRGAVAFAGHFQRGAAGAMVNTTESRWFFGRFAAKIWCNNDFELHIYGAKLVMGTLPSPPPMELPVENNREDKKLGSSG